MASPNPDAPAPDTSRPAASRRLPRGWLVAFVVLLAVLVVSVIVLIRVISPPSYEPVPIPSVSST